MALYSKTTWVNDTAPARNATNLNKQEQGIYNNSVHAEADHAPDTAPASDITGITGADAITNMVSLTQAEYDAIGTPDAATLYVIVD